MKGLVISTKLRLTFELTDKNFKLVKKVLQNLKKNGIKISEPIYDGGK